MWLLERLYLPESCVWYCISLETSSVNLPPMFENTKRSKYIDNPVCVRCLKLKHVTLHESKLNEISSMDNG